MAASNTTNRNKSERKNRIKTAERNRRLRQQDRDRSTRRHESDDDRGCLSLEFCSRPVK